jgi:hypothetical protein
MGEDGCVVMRKEHELVNCNNGLEKSATSRGQTL